MSGVWQHGPHGWRTKPRSPALPPRDRKCHTRPRAESSGSARSSAAGLVIYAPRHSPTRGHTGRSGKRSLASGSQADTRLGLLGRLPRRNNPDPAKYAHCMVRRVLTVLFAALAAACAGAAGLTGPPHPWQLVALIGACICTAAYQIIAETNSTYPQKNPQDRASSLIAAHNRWSAPRRPKKVL